MKWAAKSSSSSSIRGEGSEDTEKRHGHRNKKDGIGIAAQSSADKKIIAFAIKFSSMGEVVALTKTRKLKKDPQRRWRRYL